MAKTSLLTAAEALNIIAANVRALEPINVGLPRALGLALAEIVVAEVNVPPFDNSGMDGYAVRAADTVEAPKILSLIDDIGAGAVAKNSLAPGTAIAITTGARIPDGCDAVIQQELTEKGDTEHIKILAEVAPGTNIRKAGADIAKGKVALVSGQVIRPQELGILASLGKNFVLVTRPPEIAVLPTGNELVELDKPLPEGKIRNSNAYTLAGLIEEQHALPVHLEIAVDSKEDLREKIAQGLKSDMLITSGGVSVGKYDFVLETLKELGVEILFWKVNIKPGMPMVFGMKDGKPVFGLPGNPVSTMITFMQFVKPAIERLMGKNRGKKITLRAKLAHGIKKTDGRRHFVRGILERVDGGLMVSSTGSQISNVLSSLSLANCLIILPEEIESVQPGDIVEVELL